jgi:hypothetical protein
VSDARAGEMPLKLYAYIDVGGWICWSRQVDRDCEFLEQENIMDYSLLVGVHFRDTRDRLLTGGWLR